MSTVTRMCEDMRAYKTTWRGSFCCCSRREPNEDAGPPGAGGAFRLETGEHPQSVLSGARSPNVQLPIFDTTLQLFVTATATPCLHC
jgi:hypothetical protein